MSTTDRGSSKLQKSRSVPHRWLKEIEQARPESVLVLCSYSPKARDPARAGNPVVPTNCTGYRCAGDGAWRPWPRWVRVSHPFRTRKVASAFVVRAVHYDGRPFMVPDGVSWRSATD